MTRLVMMVFFIVFNINNKLKGNNMDIPHTLCTQLLDESGNTYMWMGLMMFCLGIFLGIMFQKDENGELS